MTKSGFDKLKRELNEYKTTKLEHAKKRINHARKFCDFHEDSEYEMALKELESIQKRISIIQHMIQRADITQKSESSTIEIGHTVSFQDISSGDVETYQIVGIEESDPLQGKISYNSPIAKQLLETSLGEKITVKTPHEVRRIKIIDIYHSK